MTPEPTNADHTKAWFDALANDGVEGIIPILDPEFEVTTPANLAAEPDTYTGEEGVRRYFDSFYEAMDEVSFVPHEFIEVGELVVVPFTLTARGRTSGLAFDQSAFMVFTLRNGRALGIETLATLEEAMAVAEARK